MKNRIILHIDVNNAFLSWSAVDMLNNGYQVDIRHRFAVVAGDESKRKGVVLAKSVPAKRMGVVTGESISMARSKCPNLEVFTPDFNIYKKYSDMMYNYLLTYSDEVERYSIDECFVDYTSSVNLFGDPVKVAYKIKNDIKMMFGFTVNVGVGENKLCAKMASDFAKPDKVHTLFLHEVESKMFPLPVNDLFMIGKSSSEKLKGMDINTIGELAKYPLDKLVLRFKSVGKMMHNYANGIDDSPVCFEKEEPKSISNSTVLPYNYRDVELIKKVIRKLSCKVGKRLRDNKLYADTIGIWFKYNYFDKISKQLKLDNSIVTDEEIYDNAVSLFSELWNEIDGIRAFCVFVSGLSNVRKKQLSLFEKVNSDNDLIKDVKLQSIIDDIKEKFGDTAIGFTNDYDIKKGD